MGEPTWTIGSHWTSRPMPTPTGGSGEQLTALARKDCEPRRPGSGWGTRSATGPKCGQPLQRQTIRTTTQHHPIRSHGRRNIAQSSYTDARCPPLS
jgi:hypothetical protein